MPAVLYLLAVILLAAAAFGVTAGRVSLVLLAAALALLAYAWPGIAGLVARLTS